MKILCYVNKPLLTVIHFSTSESINLTEICKSAFFVRHKQDSYVHFCVNSECPTVVTSCNLTLNICQKKEASLGHLLQIRVRRVSQRQHCSLCTLQCLTFLLHRAGWWDIAFNLTSLWLSFYRNCSFQTRTGQCVS